MGSKYINHIIEHYDPKFASDILENYTISYINDFCSGKNIGQHLSEIFGNLAFLYSIKDVENENKISFVDRFFNATYSINSFLARHISDFFEIILSNDKELVNFYLDKLNSEDNTLFNDDRAILYKAVICPALNNELEIEEILKKIEYPWRSYYEMSSYFYYYNDNVAALKYIKQAIDCCPLSLKKEYLNKKKRIIDSILKE
ncbi:MAG: hypothetical protein ACERKV_03110 [Clostridiaceae bacterium]